MISGAQHDRHGAWKSAGVGLACFLIGALGALVVRLAPAEPPVLSCPPAPPCPACICEATAAPAPSRAVPGTAPRPAIVHTPPTRRETPTPLPALVEDPDNRHERLRKWFESQTVDLVDCIEKDEPRRSPLLQIRIEPDGRVSDASLLGVTDLPQAIAECVRDRVKEIRFPQRDVRGRETVVVHLRM